jgi:hypothetical protein
MTKIDFAKNNYFAQIPYYVLFSKGISVNELLFYAFIHRYEHDPDPEKQAFFSFAWIALQLDIDVRSAKRIAQRLKERGFITRQQIGNKWVWNTSRFQVVIQDDRGMTECFIQDEPVTDSVTGGVTQPVTGGVTERVTHIKKEINEKETTTTKRSAQESEPANLAGPSSSSSGFLSVEEGLGHIIGPDADRMLWQANREQPCHAKDKVEFLKWCKYWMENNCKVPDEPGKMRVLMSIIRKGGLSRPKGFDGESKIVNFTPETWSAAQYRKKKEEEEARKLSGEVLKESDPQIALDILADLKKRILKG